MTTVKGKSTAKKPVIKKSTVAKKKKELKPSAKNSAKVKATKKSVDTKKLSSARKPASKTSSKKKAVSSSSAIQAKAKTTKKPMPKEAALETTKPEGDAVTYKEFEATDRLSEEYQVTGFHFALLSKEDEMTHPWVKCRDFLQDAVRAQITGKKASIYAFTYEKGLNPEVDLDNTRILVKRNPEPRGKEKIAEFKSMLENGLKIIHIYEDKYKMSPKTRLISTTNSPAHFVFQGPKDWVNSSVMISLYTLFIRLGHKQFEFENEESLVNAFRERVDNIAKGKVSTNNDDRMLQIIWSKLPAVFKHRDELMYRQENKILFENSDISSFHHNSGIVALLRGSVPDKELAEKFRKYAEKSHY